MPPGFAASRHWPHRVFLAVAHAWVGGGAARECVGFGLTASAAVAMLLPCRRRGVEVVAVVSRAESNGVWRSEQPAKYTSSSSVERISAARLLTRHRAGGCLPAHQRAAGGRDRGRNGFSVAGALGRRAEGEGRGARGNREFPTAPSTQLHRLAEQSQAERKQ